MFWEVKHSAAVAGDSEVILDCKIFRIIFKFHEFGHLLLLKVRFFAQWYLAEHLLHYLSLIMHLFSGLRAKLWSVKERERKEEMAAGGGSECFPACFAVAVHTPSFAQNLRCYSFITINRLEVIHMCLFRCRSCGMAGCSPACRWIVW